MANIKTRQKYTRNNKAQILYWDDAHNMAQFFLCWQAAGAED